jgi:hypothetical protein
VGPRTGKETEARVEEKILSPLPRIEHRSSGRPARSQTEISDTRFNYIRLHIKLYKNISTASNVSETKELQ